MNSLDYVTTRLESMIQQGRSKPEIVREIAKCCQGWPYVFGAWGEQCTPAGRRRRKRSGHPTIVTACQVLSEKKTTCDGCKWNLPVRMYDCRGFTDWALNQVGIDMYGETTNTQWRTKSNWAIRGKISEMPRDKVCVIFEGTEDSKPHTGLYLGDGTTAECRSGVELHNLEKRWTFYAVPVGLYDGGDIPVPTDKPTLRRGNKGVYVTLMQSELIQKGYECGASGADGVFGKGTENAVKAFQKDHGLTADGICGPRTWDALDNTPEIQVYTVHIPQMPLYKAEALVNQYPGAWMTKEGGDSNG